MKRLRFTVVKNAVANVIRGGATAIVALALPHFLTRALDHDRFAAWALMLQIAAYASYLDFGLQTAVARYLAQAIERGDDEQRDQLVSTAFVLLSVAGALALTLIGMVAWQLPRMFSHIPVTLIADTRGGVLMLAASAALLLPLSTFTGVLIGLHRNEYPALAIGGSRLLGAFAVILASRHTSSLLWLALCIGVPNLLGGFVQAAIAREFLPAMRIHLVKISKVITIELVRYCSVLTLFSFAMLAISGLDITIVGYFSFSDVGYYAIASTLITFFSGLNAAVFNAFLTPVAVLHTRGEFTRIRHVILGASRMNTYANLLLTSLILAFGQPVLRLWVGQDYARQAFPILVVLMLGQAVRLTGSPYASSLIGLGEHKSAIVPVVIEALTNLVLSLGGVILIGPIGVAWATLAAAALGLSCYVAYTFKKVRVLQLGGAEFIVEGIIVPVACLLPLLLCSFFMLTTTLNLHLVVIWLACLMVSLFIALRWGAAFTLGVRRTRHEMPASSRL